jgi:hypothetical protein
MRTEEEQNRSTATQLLNAAISYARLILRKYGELGPFGYAMDREGQIFRETLEIPRLPTDPTRLWKLLSDHMADRVRRGAIQALAMAADVSLHEPSSEGYVDAIVVSIEEASGYATEVTVPYRVYGGHLRNLLPRRIVFGKVVAEDAVCRIFTGQRVTGS